MKIKKIVPVFSLLHYCFLQDVLYKVQAENKGHQIDMEEAEKIMKEEKDYIILDVRTRKNMRRAYSSCNQYSK